MKKSTVTALSGVLAALSVVLLYISAVVWIFQYTSPLLCGLIMIILLESVDKKAALGVYISVSVLSLLLLPDKEAALLYALFFGWYPLAKPTLDRLKLFVLRIGLKLLLFNTAMVAAQLLLIYVFGIPFDDFLGKWGAVILLAAGNLIFLMYERLFGFLVIVYRKKYKNKIDKYLK